ncbi:MAG: TROVE domain-containing protein [Planctomycetota bacterium]|jgi:hypothetical protein
MPKFNKPISIREKILREPDLTFNKENAIAFIPDAKTDLTLRVLTWLVNEPKFYDTTNENAEINALIASVADSDPQYLMQLAMYARQKMYLRSAPVYILVESSQYESVKPFIRGYVPRIVRRVDELTETLALYINNNGSTKALPNSLKKGLQDASHNFDRYQYGKYNRPGQVSLRDFLRIIHPKPVNEEESQTFKMILDDNLPTPKTWETVISTKGSNKEAWASVFPRMGYMATLRNLRNFLKVGLDVDPVVKRLTDPERVARSKQFPFRFYSAMKVLHNLSDGDQFDRNKLINAVVQAIDLSTSNVPRWTGRTFIMCDNSWSMRTRSLVSHGRRVTTIKPYEIANILGAIAFRINPESLIGSFAEIWRELPLNPADTILTNAQYLINNQVGSSTYAYRGIRWLRENKLSVDRILVISDEQCYDEGLASINSLAGELERYKREVNRHVYTYSIDLCGYGTLQFPESQTRVCNLAGWSEKVFEFIKLYEETGKGLVDVITNADV